MSVAGWSIPGSGGEPVIGDRHLPAGEPRGVALIAHGFKGYKDYGMFPRLASACADAGLVAHRFNFSHSGMTNSVETFERPDLFERDTWNRQVHDLGAVIDALRGGVLDGADLPYILFGHSRGGVSVLLTAGRRWGDESFALPAGVITAAAPSRCNTLSDDEQALLLRQGWIESPSGRTGQALRVGAAALREQLDDPGGHDLLALAARIACPALVVHGTDDPTVPVECASEIGRAIGERAIVSIVDGGDHVFNTPNPLPADAAPSPQLAALLDAMTSFARRVTE